MQFKDKDGFVVGGSECSEIVLVDAGSSREVSENVEIDVDSAEVANSITQTTVDINCL